MAWLNVLVLCVTLLAVAPKPSISSGFDANIKDFPYQALLGLEGIHVCGGAIVSERHIVTAGSCIIPEIGPGFYRTNVVTGTTNRYNGGNSHDIENITVHPNFTTVTNKFFDRKINDIAIITLKNKIVFDDSQQKLKLPEHDYQVGQKVHFTGWGRTTEQGATEQLQKLELGLLSREECQKQVIDPAPAQLEILDTDVCTNNIKESGTCIDDDGGLLASNGVLVGVVSGMDGERCGKGHPVVFANVYKFKDFINSVINA